MTTLTLNIPQKSASKYKEIFDYFIVNYDITELEQIKNKYKREKVFETEMANSDDIKAYTESSHGKKGIEGFGFLNSLK